MITNQPGWMKRFRSDAELYLKQELVRAIDFSQGTYQVEVIDRESQNVQWPFFQFDEKGELKDAFCSCDAENGCVHQAAALLKIYRGHSEPLHIRFRHSFWNILCQILCEHSGYDPSILQKKGKGQYAFRNDVAMQIRARSHEQVNFLSRILEKRPRETPENSLKFSELSQDELLHWKEGRPSQKLRFELSFWADLAKNWMFRQEENQSYDITFTDSSEGYPTLVRLEWKDIEVLILLSVSDLPQLIPSLSTVKASLIAQKITEKKVDQILYDPIKKRFTLTHHDEVKKIKMPDQAIWIDGWRYVPGKGFFAEGQDSLLFSSEIPSKNIVSFLDKHHKEVAPLLKNATIHSQPVSASYSIAFDSEWNLQLEAFLFEKGDLEKSQSAFFGRWAYLEGKGFFPVQDVLFETITKKIPSKDISHFVNEHRIWLNSQEGFITHLASIETHLSYSVTPEGTLRFFGRLFSQEGTIGAKDFGDWIFFEKLGFFSKKFTRLGSGVRPGMEIPVHAISDFIKTHREELEGVPNFFFSECPLAKRGLNIQAVSENSVEIIPEFELHPQFAKEKIRFFDEYIYIETKGFCELPLKMRLPQEFQHRELITSESFSRFFEEDFEKLKFLVTTLDPKLKKPHKCVLEIDYLAKNPEGGLKAQLFYVTEFGKVAVTDLLQFFHKKKQYYFSEGGLFDLREERFQWIRQLPGSPLPDSKAVLLSTLDFLRLDASDAIHVSPQITPFSEITHTLLKELREFSLSEKPNPKELKSSLRQYQESGLYWLWFLYQNGLSGLLCDEMGLGKTHQAMALIASCLDKKEKKERKFLVVCPTSVIYHWQDKLEAFLPSLKVHTFHGSKRSLKRLPKECVILTSYGILRMEKEALKAINFDVAIFDEIQNAKNPHSRIHHALMTVQAKMRLGLTGTPIENNLQELKALFDIVLPGYMPSESKFREHFVLPIEKEGSEEKKALLRQLIKPFILRRRKQEVLKELPDKSEDKSYCELSEEQKQLYQEILEKSRDSVEELRKEAPIPYLHIFSILSSLKQVCNHPALIAKDPQNYKHYQSGKWDLFIELLEEARESEQKVVVFSQYLQMLDIIEAYIKEKGWDYAQIRGDTLNRREQLRKFQEDPSCVIFLGSLQAAGVGIDLTAASIVILFDRWWNAARENQAIDRVHRIGQKWGVQVYKLITKQTIEEKIDRMITKKGKLLEEVIAFDDQALLKKFSREELIDLLTQ